MATIETLISELAVGEPLAGDVVDPSGNVLLVHGTRLAPETVNSWLGRGFAKVLIRQFDSLAQYDSRILEQLAECHHAAVAAIDDLVLGLCMREDINVSPLEGALRLLSEAINQDADAALSSTAELCDKPMAKSVALANRSIAMATLGAATALCLGLTPEQCKTVSMAGMLHDLSLFEEPLAELTRNCQTEAERREVQMNHPLHSAELLASCRGISDQARVIIAQVHEQVDGTGFPRNLSHHHLGIPSRILNIIDAFLTLTDLSGPALVPADAMCYLVRHATDGSFDVDCMKGFLAAVSMYPIGSQVQLSNSALATVYRSSRTDPLRPIVRIDQGEIVDLRNTSIVINAPHLGEGFRRLNRSIMDHVLWKPAFVTRKLIQN